MVERIRAILDRYQLTSTQFADAIGTARPIVSHILSGRNKPSLEVVQKITAAFPDLSLSWLLSGSGPIEASAPPAEQASLPAKAPVKPSTPRTAAYRPSTATQVEEASTEAPKPPRGEQAAQPSLEAPSLPVMPAVAAEPIASPAPTVANLGSAPTAAPVSMLQAFAEPGKAIRRIVIFYSDGTFSDYQPEASTA